MQIVIACGAMSFGPHTLDTQSLGGSETAALMLGKELAKRGHSVKMFCNLPPRERPDYWPGGKADDSVIYVALDHYAVFAGQAQTDLTIIVRDPRLASIPALTKKKVLWMHDIATKRGMQRALEQMEWCIDEVWTVSEWHRQQVHTVTGYPLDHIKALRNGIVPVETMPAPRLEKQLVYAARPERGLDNLIMPGGIMDNLPDYNLVVCMYDHFPEHMRDYYEQIFRRMAAMPNVQYLGPKPQCELRQIIRDSAAYIYPTQFEETSCILARECIEQQTPFLSTEVGALPETLGYDALTFENWCGRTKPLVFMDDMPKEGTPEWGKLFADFVRDTLADKDRIDGIRFSMSQRNDLYWDGVAAMVEQYAEPRPTTVFSRAWSLVQDGDVIVAKAYLEHTHPDDPPETWSFAEAALWYEITSCYPFLKRPGDHGYKSMAEFYEWVYSHKEGTEENELVFHDDFSGQRLEAIAAEVAKLPEGSRVLEYGCGCGHLLAPLARRFPHLQFVGVDIAANAVAVVNNGAAERGYKNLVAYTGTTENWPENIGLHQFDAAIVSEVLEHVIEPWTVARDVESRLRTGGRMIVTTPFGYWDTMTFRQPKKWHWRAHIWHLDAHALLGMFKDKNNLSLRALPLGADPFLRPVGNTLCVYDADHNEPHALDLIQKALHHLPRQTTCACVIAMDNAATIQRMLDSLADTVQGVRIALGPSTDGTRDIINQWASAHPWVPVQIIDAPKIEPYKFGFDDARKLSTYGYDGEIRDFDWFLWIDTDEYLSGNFLPYLRNSSMTGYIVPQHHFTVEPRGAATQIDKPARLLRVDAGYKCVGHIHEHFQLDDGVGRVYMLPNVDIGHVGYVNETVRRTRFARNFEFLEWDHKDPPAEGQRKLHHFLWFRDIVHRLRLAINARDLMGARKLAEEGLTYYNSHWQDMLTFGQGLHMGLAYVSEIRHYLGLGTPVKIALQFEDRQTVIEGRFEHYADLERLMKAVADPEFVERNSRYY